MEVDSLHSVQVTPTDRAETRDSERERPDEGMGGGLQLEEEAGRRNGEIGLF